jgi:hypothetical protein
MHREEGRARAQAYERTASTAVASGASPGNGRGKRERRTFELPKDAIHGAGAAAAGHADVEFVGVCVFRHLCFFLPYLSLFLLELARFADA